MDNISILIGGKAGEGINQAGLAIARLINRLGYRIYIYYDYPSLIRGGHNFSIIRASKERIATHNDKIDFLIALNQDCITLHKDRLKQGSYIIYNRDAVKLDDVSAGRHTSGLSLGEILKQEDAPPLMANSCLIGAFCKTAGIGWDILEDVFKTTFTKGLDLNLKVARRGYDTAGDYIRLKGLAQKPLPVLTGNEAIGLGLIKGGLTAYVAYPMTPSSSLLHFLAGEGQRFSLKVIHPESEIGVILMALGFAYVGEKVAVGTSGGGFCLMTEGLSLAGMSESPVVIVVSQRPGPSTGVPTYTAQGDLHFVLNAGQGEFTRFVVSPGDAEEAYLFSQVALKLAWKYQIPSLILVDKTLSEGTYNLDIDSIGKLDEEGPLLWDKKSPFKRYLDTETGVSPLSFVPEKGAVIKLNSYEHDEYGLTTEVPQQIAAMQDKRMRKESCLIKEIERYQAVNIYGNRDARTALLCWGSNKGVCAEVARNLGLKVIQPVILSPFPIKQFQEAVRGVERIICIENNSTAQLARLLNSYGFSVHDKILKYDGRPFSLEGLQERLNPLISKG